MRIDPGHFGWKLDFNAAIFRNRLLDNELNNNFEFSFVFVVAPAVRSDVRD